MKQIWQTRDGSKAIIDEPSERIKDVRTGSVITSIGPIRMIWDINGQNWSREAWDLKERIANAEAIESRAETEGTSTELHLRNMPSVQK